MKKVYKVYDEAYTKCTKCTVEKVYTVYDEAYTKCTKCTMERTLSVQSVWWRKCTMKRTLSVQSLLWKKCPKLKKVYKVYDGVYIKCTIKNKKFFMLS